MTPGSNFSAEGAENEGKRCVVNDQMEPFIVIYILIFIISLCGSLMSVWTFIHSPRDKRSGSVYLMNLLAADLLLLLALPFKILKDLRVASWSLMVFHCQASAVTIYISLYASIVFLALIITNCYLQDCDGVCALRLQEVGFARLLSVVVWLLLLLIMVPNMALPIQEVKVSQYLSCSSLKKDLGLHWHALTVFLCTALFLNALAAVLISSGLSLKRLLGSRGNPGLWADARRVAVSVTVALAAYMLSFVPYHAVRTPYTLAQTKVISDCQTKRRLFLGKESTLMLALVHVCLHPLVYYYLHPPFRRTAQRLMTWRRGEEKDGGGAGGGGPGGEAPTQVENHEEERFNP
ncbi:probable G-protein coupled receptor 171 [Sphaeramia orbicularis]|uniref:Probable G-protein coupled receptor 171 n=1 Tax=Sphaeramia orbicularis TaxID=375764 RepID=A0A672YE60_9TELE|nr:probable G-protein coupled receptor 171 [Sphaeramia orbicularis]XP_030007175.1 probable G-protein coupled receptor 171 [Sphaeramia orbicularis]